MDTPTALEVHGGQAEVGTPICGAKRRQGGGPCKHQAGWGTTHVGYGRCKMHGGASPTGNRAAARAMARDQLAHYGVTAPENVDPITVLDSLMNEAFAQARALGGMVGTLKPEVDAEGNGIAVPDHKGNPRPHVFVEMFDGERDRAHRIARDAMALDLIGRQQALDRADAERMLDAFQGAIADVGLDDQLADALRSAFAARLRGLEA